MMKNNINFSQIVTRAYETLIIQDDLSFPLDIFNLKIDYNVKIISFDELAEASNTKFEDILEQCDSADAFRYKDKKNNYYFIVYNNRITSKARIRWSIAHEYGHIVLGHGEQSGINEVEANFFAANLLVPRCILKELIRLKDNFSKTYIKNKFGISQAAADRYFSNINSKGFEFYKNEYDDIIIEKAKLFFDKEIKNSKKYMDYYEDQLQEERNSWLYE